MREKWQVIIKDGSFDFINLLKSSIKDIDHVSKLCWYDQLPKANQIYIIKLTKKTLDKENDKILA